MLQKLKSKFKNLIQRLQYFTDRSWYSPLLGFLSFIDIFIIIIPNDGLLISSAILSPKKWLSLALYVAFGSTLGAIVLAFFVQLHGLPLILKFYPELTQSEIWIQTFKFFQEYGLIVVFLVALAPLAQQPVVILASLSHTPFYKLAAVTCLGRVIKYLFMSYISSHAPKLLNKLWGVHTELEEVGIKVD
jgi:membrane protein YqaA with SNARE-associated domain